MKTTPRRLLDQFASTFKEWHYLIGGGAAGFLLGIVVAFYVVLRVERAHTRRRGGI